MPFNETNDYTSSQWQEKVWHITDNRQSPILFSGLLWSRQHCWLSWPGWREEGTPALRPPAMPCCTHSEWLPVVPSCGAWRERRCLLQVVGERGRREDVHVRCENVVSLRCVIACEVFVAAVSRKNVIIKNESLFFLDALLLPICCILFLLSAIFLPSLCLILISSFLQFYIFIVCSFLLTVAFFTPACLHSFSFSEYFPFFLFCDLPYSLATFHAMEQCSWVAGWLKIASPPWTRLHLQSSGTDYMLELIKDAVGMWISGTLARYPHVHVPACWCVSMLKMSVSPISSADWVLF